MSNESPLTDSNVEMVVHQGTSPAVFCNLQGANGSIDGYNCKYKLLAERVNSEFGFTVVRTNWPMHHHTDGSTNFHHVMSYIVDSFPNMPILLMASSNSAIFSAMYSYLYPQITRMLFINPPFSLNTVRQKEGLRKTTARATTLFGELDPGYTMASQLMTDWNTRFISLPGMDHHFSQMGMSDFISLPEIYLFDAG